MGPEGQAIRGAASAVSDGRRRRSRVQNNADSEDTADERDKRDKEPDNAEDSSLAKAGSSSSQAPGSADRGKLRQVRFEAGISLVRAEHVMFTDPDMT